MAVCILRRFLLCVPTFLGITFVTFAVIHLAPGNPAAAAAGAGEARMTAGQYERLREQYHLDEPVHRQYVHWLASLVRWDLGLSFRDGRPVAEKIGERFWPTLILTVSAIAVSLVVSIPLGVHAARRAGGWFDRIVAGTSFGLYAVPRYVMGMLLIVLVGVRLDWFPFVGLTSRNHAELGSAAQIGDVVWHSILIGACFAYPLIAYLTRFLRDNLVEVLSSDFITAARARGLSERRIAYCHALPNAMLPMLTLLGLMLPSVIGGAVILEVMFSWPGMGRLMFDAIMQRDYPVVMALTTLTAVVVLLGTLAVDLLYVIADPRVRSV